MRCILEIKRLCKRFKESDDLQGTVLNGIDLEIQSGEFVVVMGQSGSGKSTLLYNVSGMDQMTSGTVKFDGEDISTYDDKKMSDLRLSKMGFVFQHAHLLKNLSIQDNIMFPGFKLGKESRAKIIKRAEMLMEKVNIKGVRNHDITQVSGGQLQRAAICRALINKPRILFGDEPTGALNSSSTKEVMDILNQINLGGTTIMLVTHDAKVAARADRVIYLSDGKIEAECTMGKYKMKEAELKLREEKIARWLRERNF